MRRLLPTEVLIAISITVSVFGAALLTGQDQPLWVLRTPASTATVIAPGSSRLFTPTPTPVSGAGGVTPVVARPSGGTGARPLGPATPTPTGTPTATPRSTS